MRINVMLAAIGFAFAIAPVLYPDETSAAPKCQVKDCRQLDGTFTRAQVSAACQANGGIETGTTATSGGFGCYSEGTGKGNFVECDDQGKCIGGPAQRIGKGKRPDLNAILKKGPAPARK